MRNGLKFLFCAMLVAFVGTAFAATKTVKASGGADYTSLAKAVDNVYSNAKWGNDVADDVIILDGFTSETTSVSYYGSGGTSGTLTIRGINNARVCQGQPGKEIRFIIRARSGVLNAENITFFSFPAATDNQWCPIGMETAGGLGELTVNLKNCIFTVPVPGDTFNPRLDWGTNPLAVGNQRVGIQASLDDPSPASYHLNAENCTFFIGGGWGGMRFQTDARMSTGTTTNIKNCLFIGCKSGGYVNPSSKITTTIDDSAFVYCAVTGKDANGRYLRGNEDAFGLRCAAAQPAGKPQTITDTIFANNGYATIGRVTQQECTVILNRVTAYSDSTTTGPDVGAFWVSDSGQLNLTMKDVLFGGETAHSIFGIEQPALPGLKSLTLDGGIAVTGGWVAPTGTAPGGAEFAALNGGTGPTTDDPTFVNKLVDAKFNSYAGGPTGWDRTQNDFLDIGSITLRGKGSADYTARTPYADPLAVLAGGADPGPGVPVELGSFQVE